ncbi:hypothetical protein CDAR_107871 [Caerostris darwini]|uniref:C2H2-type domain-containing protein n=1 Tax=Caerostris darwini TaxID=1538125 RepID=A0AAV4SGC3_9ARAC|nr:hypothetical protein CDAR_107871 [Caerostris darwini]
MYSNDRNTNYSSGDQANMPIFSKNERSNPTSNSKSRNINFDLYTQALAAKSNLGLLDLHSHGSHVHSPGDVQDFNSPSRSLCSNLNQSTMPEVTSCSDIWDAIHSSYSDNCSNSNVEKTIKLKPLTDLNLISVDEEDEFLYGDSDLHTENLFSVKQIEKETKLEADFLDEEILISDRSQNSVFQAKSELSKDFDIKLNVNSWNKTQAWSFSNDANSKSMKHIDKEQSTVPKQNKISIETCANSPSIYNRKSSDAHTFHDISFDKSKWDSSDEITENSSKNIPTKNSNAVFSSHSIKESSSSFIENKTDMKSIDAANFLRKQLNLDVLGKQCFPKKFGSTHKATIENDKQAFLDNEEIKDTISDISVLNKRKRRHELFINTNQEERRFPKRFVDVKKSDNPESQYNLNSSSKPDSPSILFYGRDHDKNFELSDNLHVETLKISRDKNRRSSEKIKFDDEKYSSPKHYIEKEYQEGLTTKLGEKNSKASVARHIKREIEPKAHLKNRFTSRSYRGKSVERRRSSSCSPNQHSPEPSRRKSPCYHSHRYSPNYKYHSRSPDRYSRNWSRDRSPYYDRKESPDRSPRRNSDRKARSPFRLTRRHSRSSSPGKDFRSSWDRSPIRLSKYEKNIAYNDDISPCDLRGKIIKKRPLGYNSEDEDVKDTEKRIALLRKKLKQNSESAKKISNTISDRVASKKNEKIEVLQQSDHLKFTKIEHEQDIERLTSIMPSIGKEVQDPYNSNLIHPVFENIGINSPQFSSPINNVNHTATGISEAPTPMQQQSVTSCVSQYNRQFSQLPSPIVSHLYPPYLYSAPPSVDTNFPYNTMYPSPFSPASYSYSSNSAELTNRNPTNFQSNIKPINSNSKIRVSCLKPVPVLESLTTQDLTSETVVKPQNLISVEPVLKPSINLLKSKSAGTSDSLKDNAVSKVKDSFEDEQQLIKSYKKLLEDRELLQKKLRNTSDHTLELRNLKVELQKKWKTTKSHVDKLLSINCANLHEKANMELKRYIDEAKQLSLMVKDMKARIKPDIFKKFNNTEVIEKKCIETTFKYSCYDTGGHWCENCNQQFPTIAMIMNHLQDKNHELRHDPKNIVVGEPLKDNFDKNVKLLPVRGVEFIMPVHAFYCSLCKEPLLNIASAEHHLKGHNHTMKYMSFLKENPVYEKKRDMFKKAGTAILSKERQKELEEVLLAKHPVQEKQNVEKCKNQETGSPKKVQGMEKEIMEVGETETNTSSKNAKGSGIKLKLLSEKNKPLELNPTKEPEAKPKQKVVYIGRAPNFKPRPVLIDKNKTEISKSKNTTATEKYSVKSISEDSKCSNEDNKSEDFDFTLSVTLDNCKSRSIKNESSNNSDKQVKTNNIEAVSSPNHDKKCMSKKVREVVYGCLSEKESKKLQTSTAECKPLKKAAEFLAYDSQISQDSKKELIGDKSTSLSQTNIKPSENSVQISAASIVQKRTSLTEEEKDFLLLSIPKTDMVLIAVPKPPPSSLIYNPADIATKRSSSSPCVQKSPPNIGSEVAPSNLTTEVLPSDVILQVPPSCIASQVPSDLAVQVSLSNTTSQIPSPVIVSNSSNLFPGKALSDQQLQMNSNSFITSNTLPYKNMTDEPLQSAVPKECDINTVDMEIYDSCQEKKIQSNFTTEEIPTLNKPVIDDQSSSLSASCVKEIGEREKLSYFALNKEQNNNGCGISKVSNETNISDEFSIKDFVNCLIDTTSRIFIKCSSEDKNVAEMHLKRFSLPSSDKIINLNENALKCHSSFNSINIEDEKVSMQLENSEITQNTEINMSSVDSTLEESLPNEKFSDCLTTFPANNINIDLSENYEKKSESHLFQTVHMGRLETSNNSTALMESEDGTNEFHEPCSINSFQDINTKNNHDLSDISVNSPFLNSEFSKDESLLYENINREELSTAGSFETTDTSKFSCKIHKIHEYRETEQKVIAPELEILKCHLKDSQKINLAASDANQLEEKFDYRLKSTIQKEFPTVCLEDKTFSDSERNSKNQNNGVFINDNEINLAADGRHENPTSFKSEEKSKDNIQIVEEPLFTNPETTEPSINICEEKQSAEKKEFSFCQFINLECELKGPKKQAVVGNRLEEAGGNSNSKCRLQDIEMTGDKFKETLDTNIVPNFDEKDAFQTQNLDFANSYILQTNVIQPFVKLETQEIETSSEGIKDFVKMDGNLKSQKFKNYFETKLLNEKECTKSFNLDNNLLSEDKLNMSISSIQNTNNLITVSSFSLLNFEENLTSISAVNLDSNNLERQKLKKLSEDNSCLLDSMTDDPLIKVLPDIPDISLVAKQKNVKSDSIINAINSFNSQKESMLSNSNADSNLCLNFLQGGDKKDTIRKSDSITSFEFLLSDETKEENTFSNQNDFKQNKVSGDISESAMDCSEFPNREQRNFKEFSKKKSIDDIVSIQENMDFTTVKVSLHLTSTNNENIQFEQNVLHHAGLSKEKLDTCSRNESFNMSFSENAIFQDSADISSVNINSQNVTTLLENFDDKIESTCVSENECQQKFNESQVPCKLHSKSMDSCNQHYWNELTQVESNEENMKIIPESTENINIKMAPKEPNCIQFENVSERTKQNTNESDQVTLLVNLTDFSNNGEERNLIKSSSNELKSSSIKSQTKEQDFDEKEAVPINISQSLEGNSQNKPEVILSVPYLEKFDTDDILSNISIDGPPILSDCEESTNKSFKEITELNPNSLNDLTQVSETTRNESLKDVIQVSETATEEKIEIVKLDSDTDEYETTDN